MQTTRLLKIVGGIHTGAEMPLSHGRYRIGRSQECDIVLHDELVTDTHLELVVEEGSTIARSLSTLPFYVNGNECPAGDKGVVITQKDVVELGTTFFSVGNIGAEWLVNEIVPHANVKTKSWLEIQATLLTDAWGSAKNRVNQTLEKIKTHPVISLALAIVRPKVDDDLKPTSDTPLALPSEQSAVDSNASGFASQDDKLASMSFKQKALTTTVALLALITIAFPLFSSLFSEDPYIELSAYLDEHNFTRVNVETDNHRIVLKGYIKSTSRKLNLLKFAQRKRIDTVDRLYVDETIRKKVAALKEAKKLDGLRVNYSGSGVATATGYVGSLSDWEHFRVSVLRDVAGMVALTNADVKDVAYRKAKLQEIIDNNGMRGSIYVKRGEDATLIVSGMLPPNQIREWNASITSFRKMYGSSPRIISKVENPLDIISLDIKELQLGEIKFIVTEDGTRYFEGAYIPGGFLVKNISSNYVNLEKDGVIAKFPVGA